MFLTESSAASLRLSAEEPCRSHSSASDEQAALQGEPAAGAPGRVAVPEGPACQVEGCDRDLAALSAYHQKCRVCDLHIKAPSFVRAGLLQRFCQRCGRCHELGAFEGTRRSCRAQLAKHNARWGPYAPSPCAGAASLRMAKFP